FCQTFRLVHVLCFTFLREMSGTEGEWIQVPCNRTPTAANFASGGLQSFDFSVGSNYAWNPKKSYFRFKMSLVTVANTGIPLKPSDLTTLADNACGNLYDNI